MLISGGVATNVLPDECVVTVNYRFAPDRSESEALVFVKDFFDGFEVEVTDSAPAALPGLGVPAAKAFVDAAGGTVNPKFGWTDVARFAGLGVPAVNYGPGDPMLAHKQEEFVPIERAPFVRGHAPHVAGRPSRVSASGRGTTRSRDEQRQGTDRPAR